MNKERIRRIVNSRLGDVPPNLRRAIDSAIELVLDVVDDERRRALRKAAAAKKAAGEHVGRPATTAETVTAVYRLKALGGTPHAIARVLNLSTSTVYDIVNEEGYWRPDRAAEYAPAAGTERQRRAMQAAVRAAFIRAKNAGLKSGRLLMREGTVWAILAAHNEGLAVDVIAERLGLDSDTVHRTLTEDSRVWSGLESLKWRS